MAAHDPRVRRVLLHTQGWLELLSECGEDGVPRTPPRQREASRDPHAQPPPTTPLPTEVAARARSESLEEIRADLGDCVRCKLSAGRTTIVFGVGNPNAEIAFVGEGPGQDEDLAGEPFVGKAGQLLTQIIENGMGLERSEVYIMNVVKCRPPGNRDPEPDEVAACRPFLERQIAAIAPKVIVTLGKPSAQTLLGRNVAITRERGRWQDFRGIPLMPTFHPAYVLRRYTPEVRRQVWEDMKSVLARIGREPPTRR